MRLWSLIVYEFKTTWGLNKTKKSYNSFSPDKTGAVDDFRMKKKRVSGLREVTL